MDSILPLGKLPAELQAHLLAMAPAQDQRVLVGPGAGLDCAVVEAGPDLLVYKTDPITFATDEIGWYAVQVNANDIATTGALPRWMLATLLLPEQRTTPALVEAIARQLFQACQEIGVSVIGGHTEITHGLDRPVLVGTMIGEVPRQALITPRGARPGDRLLLTKGVPVEATAILSREFPERLSSVLSPAELETARQYLYQPGISVLKEARLAVAAGQVHAMHDPTEGGLMAALWELVEASGQRLQLDPARVPVPALAARICAALEIDPLSAIASGALLMAVDAEDAAAILQAVEAAGILCTEIGAVIEGPPELVGPGGERLTRPPRDEIARLFET